MVQALAAVEAIGGGGGSEPAGAPAGLPATNMGTSKGKLQVDLAWGGGDVTVDIYRNNSKIRSATSNTGAYRDAVKVSGSGTLTYKVCNAGTTTCSGNASVSY